jgi:tRNA dimethylallyltransferase
VKKEISVYANYQGSLRHCYRSWIGRGTGEKSAGVLMEVAHLQTSLPRPVVAVIGTTGVGKSNLAIALAESLGSSSRYNQGVVLSADSMQIYKGLDVITNKITKEEMNGVKHWGMDMVKPGQGNWDMGRWCKEADHEVYPL